MTSARERLVAVLALLALGGAVVLSSTQPFSSAVLTGQPAPVVVQGSQAAPALAPLGLALLALGGALTIAGRIARPVLGVVLVLLGAAVVAVALPAALDPGAGTRGVLAAATGVSDPASLVVRRTGTAWPALGAVAGALAAVLGLVVLVRSRRWSTGGRRFRRQALPAGVLPTDPVAEWDVLTRGGDPTEDPDGDGRTS